MFGGYLIVVFKQNNKYKQRAYDKDLNEVDKVLESHSCQDADETIHYRGLAIDSNGFSYDMFINECANTKYNNIWNIRVHDGYLYVRFEQDSHAMYKYVR